MKNISLSILAALLVYLLLWPVPTDPVSWEAPQNQGYIGDFAQNNLLSQIEIIELSDTHGPEGLALLNGDIYTATREGWILEYNEASGQITKMGQYPGQPTGLSL